MMELYKTKTRLEKSKNISQNKCKNFLFCDQCRKTKKIITNSLGVHLQKQTTKCINPVTVHKHIN